MLKAFSFTYYHIIHEVFLLPRITQVHYLLVNIQSLNNHTYECYPVISFVFPIPVSVYPVTVYVNHQIRVQIPSGFNYRVQFYSYPYIIDIDFKENQM